MIMNFRNFKSGFTLIEVMISVALFTIIMTIGTGAVLNVNNTHKKSQNMRTVIDNLSFVMEDMARNLRLGADYHCQYLASPPIEDPRDCPNSGLSIAFKAVDGNTVVYRILQNGRIEKAKKDENSILSFLSLTPAEVKIDLYQSGFTVIGADDNSNIQPRVIIRLSGVVEYKNNIESNFNLQTTVSQRLLE